MISRLIVFGFLLTQGLIVRAQQVDTLLLMSGQEVLIQISSDTGTMIIGKVAKRNGKLRDVSIHKLDVFSHAKASGSKTIYYAEDWAQEYFLTPEEMNVYLAGAGDAKSGYKARYVLLIGTLFSGSLAYMGGDGWATVFIPTLLYMGGQYIGKIRVDHESMRDQKYMYNDFYAAGYEAPARSKKMMRAALGGYSGATLGLILSLIINNGAAVF
jgi:hypothetical protein